MNIWAAVFVENAPFQNSSTPVFAFNSVLIIVPHNCPTNRRYEFHFPRVFFFFSIRASLFDETADRFDNWKWWRVLSKFGYRLFAFQFSTIILFAYVVNPLSYECAKESVNLKRTGNRIRRGIKLRIVDILCAPR